ncbi:phage tail assembly chaperone [bacterium]|nr:phage tail assembly chaperone [bacterium]
MYVKLVNNAPSEWPVTGARIKHDNKNVSFPADMTNSDVSSFGFAPFQYADRPEYDPEYQNCDEVTPVLSAGVYVQTWQVSDKHTAEERAAYDAQKEADRIDGLPDLHRTIRDALLAETDWWASTDLTMTAEQTAYRQALRDITDHANWPDLLDADWPIKP